MFANTKTAYCCFCLLHKLPTSLAANKPILFVLNINSNEASPFLPLVQNFITFKGASLKVLMRVGEML